jgi:phage terminase small subunit
MPAKKPGRKKKLPIKRQRFVEALVGPAMGNKTKAAAMAGYAMPESQGSRLSKFVDVQKAIEERLARAEAAMGSDEIRARLSMMAAGKIPTKTVVETGMGVAKDGTPIPVTKKRHEYNMEASTNTLAKIGGLLKDGVPTSSGTTVNILAVLGALDESKLDALIAEHAAAE